MHPSLLSSKSTCCCCLRSKDLRIPGHLPTISLHACTRSCSSVELDAQRGRTAAGMVAGNVEEKVGMLGELKVIVRLARLSTTRSSGCTERVCILRFMRYSDCYGAMPRPTLPAGGPEGDRNDRMEELRPRDATLIPTSSSVARPAHRDSAAEPEHLVLLPSEYKATRASREWNAAYMYAIPCAGSWRVIVQPLLPRSTGQATPGRRIRCKTYIELTTVKLFSLLIYRESICTFPG